MKNISLQERLLSFFTDVLIIATGNFCQHDIYMKSIHRNIDFDIFAITIFFLQPSTKIKNCIFPISGQLSFVTSDMRGGGVVMENNKD